MPSARIAIEHGSGTGSCVIAQSPENPALTSKLNSSVIVLVGATLRPDQTSQLLLLLGPFPQDGEPPPFAMVGVRIVSNVNPLKYDGLTIVPPPL